MDRQQPPSTQTTQAQPSAIPQGQVHNRAEAASTLGFAQESSFNFAMLILWLVAAFAVAATVFFWLMQNNNQTTLNDKKIEQSNVLSELARPSNKEIEKKANDFKSSVTQLSSAFKSRYSYGSFLPELYKKVNSDVKIMAISIANDGAVSLTGTTSSYRAIADQMLSLKSSAYLTDVDLASSSVSNDKGTGEFNFTISTKIVKEDKTSTSNSETNTNTTGGSGNGTGSTPSPLSNSDTNGGTQ